MDDLSFASQTGMDYHPTMQPENDQKLQDIFFPHLSLNQQRVIKEGRRFVHYTGAAAAIDILDTGRIWMRKTNTMNDFREIEHGYDCLKEALESDVGDGFKFLLHSIEPGLDTAVLEGVDAFMPTIRSKTYITCISEHDNDEDQYGRLSMWRAYGGSDTGIALVLKQGPIVHPSHAMGAYSMPVAYMAHQQVKDYLRFITATAWQEIDFLKRADSSLIKTVLLSMMRFAMVAIKHPGFREEKEWRVIFMPEMAAARRVIIEPEIVRGTPQLVGKMPLDDSPEEGLIGLTVPDFLDRIIIGPTQFPDAIRERFHHLLEKKQVADIENKVIISDIPLRR